MNRLAFATAAMIAGMTSAQAQTTQPVVWQGQIELSSVSAACQGFSVGNKFRSVLRPRNNGNAGLANNGTNSNFTVIGQRAAFRLSVIAGDFAGANTADGTTISSRAGLGQATVSFSNVNVIPSNITGNTPRLRINGRLLDFFNTAGCNVTFRGAYLKRP